MRGRRGAGLKGVCSFGRIQFGHDRFMQCKVAGFIEGFRLCAGAVRLCAIGLRASELTVCDRPGN